LQLLFVAQDERDPALERRAACPWVVSGDDGAPSGGHEQAREHLEGGRLPSAVGSKKGHDLAGGDGERYVIDCGDFAEDWVDEGTQSPNEPRVSDFDPVRLAQAVRLDGGVGCARRHMRQC
jgi:hypothetical protein